MQRWTSYTLRAGFIVGFLIVLPVMAMPHVAALLDQLLYGEARSTLPAGGGASESGTSSNSKTTGGSAAIPESPFQAEGLTSSDLPADLNPASPFQASPPTMPLAPDFVRQAGNAEPAAHVNEGGADIGPLNQVTADKIDLVRSRLEELGAEYVRLEMSADGREFHCLCHMLVGSDPDQIQPFEATRKDPVSAAEAVLSSVEAWRTAERTPARGSKSGPEQKPR